MTRETFAALDRYMRERYGIGAHQIDKPTQRYGVVLVPRKYGKADTTPKQDWIPRST